MYKELYRDVTMAFCEHCGWYDPKKGGPTLPDPGCLRHANVSYVVIEEAGKRTKHPIQSSLYSDEVTLDEVKGDLSSGNYEQKVKAADVLGQLGCVAASVVGLLNETINKCRKPDFRLKETCEKALEKITGVKAPTTSSTTPTSTTTTIDSRVKRRNIQKDVAPSEPKKIKLSFSEVKIEILCDKELISENERLFVKCAFCEKDMMENLRSRRFNERISGEEVYYCGFCIRHGYNTKVSKNVLAMSFGGIIAYYYHVLHQLQKPPKMYISQLMDYIQLHKEIGLRNPLFSYDDSSFMWFVDFNRIGKGRRNLKLEDVLETTIEIIMAFNLYRNVKDIQVNKLYAKYDEAIREYYHQRKRPEGKRVLWPTLMKCGISEYSGAKKVPWMLCRQGMLKFEDIKGR